MNDTAWPTGSIEDRVSFAIEEVRAGVTEGEGDVEVPRHVVSGAGRKDAEGRGGVGQAVDELVERAVTAAYDGERGAAAGVISQEGGLPCEGAGSVGEDAFAAHAETGEVTDSPATNIRFGNLVHADGADHAGMDAQTFQCRLHCQCVHDGGQHAHVIRRGPLHTLRRPLKAAEDVAAADDHANLNAQVMDRFHLIGDTRDRRWVQAEPLVAHQSLA